MATLLKVDGTQQEVQPAHGNKFTLAEMQKLVGGYIIPIKLSATERMVVDEDGGPRVLPPNEAATSVLRKALGPNVVTIVGNALVGNRKEFGLR